MQNNQSSNTNTANNYANGEITEALCMAVARRCFKVALPPKHADLPKKLEGITLVKASNVVEDGVIATGRRVELALMVRPMLMGCIKRAIAAAGKEDLAKKQNDTSGSNIAAGVSYFPMESTFDPSQDGSSVDIENYFPTLPEAVYDVECMYRIYGSFAKDGDVRKVINLFATFKGNDGNTVAMCPTIAFVQKTIKRDIERINKAKADAAKDKQDYLGYDYSENTKAGVEIDIFADHEAVGINEALENFERLLGLAGFTDTIGNEVLNRVGRNKALALLEAVANGNWKGVARHAEAIDLISQSHEGYSVIQQLVNSPEWQDTKDEVALEKEKRERAKEARELRREQADNERAHERRMMEAYHHQQRMAAARQRLTFDLDYARLTGNASEVQRLEVLLGIAQPAPKAKPKATVKTKKVVITKTKKAAPKAKKVAEAQPLTVVKTSLIPSYSHR